MDARELTKRYYDILERLEDLKKEVDYIHQEQEKQRMILEDLKIDIKMLEGQK